MSLSTALGHLVCFAGLSGDLQLLAHGGLILRLLRFLGGTCKDLLQRLHFERKISVEKSKNNNNPHHHYHPLPILQAAPH